MCDDEINRVPQEHLGLFIANSHGMYVFTYICVYEFIYIYVCMYVCYQCVEHVFTRLESDSYSYIYVYEQHPARSTHA